MEKAISFHLSIHRQFQAFIIGLADTPFKTYLDKILPDINRRFYNFYLASIGNF